MKSLHIVSLLLAASAAVSNALWFSSRTVDANGPTSTACLAHGAAGRCDFYSCFEARLPCGSRGYMSKYGGHYCSRFAEFYNSFNQQGKEWINATARCQSERMLAFYNQDRVNCHDLSHFAWNTWGSCYEETHFCDVFWENRAAFQNVYQFRDLFSVGSGKIWREMFQIMGRCASLRGRMEFNSRGGFQAVVDSFRNLGERLRNIVNKK